MRTLPRTLPTLLAVALAGLATTAAAQGQVYKYTDANGQVHYTDRAPSDATQVKGPTPPAPPQAARPAAPAAQTAANGAQAAPPALPVNRQQSQQVQRDVAAAREEQCVKARENYDKAIRAQRVFKTNDKGEREFISPAEADTLRLQIKAEMDGACGS